MSGRNMCVCVCECVCLCMCVPRVLLAERPNTVLCYLDEVRTLMAVIHGLWRLVSTRGKPFKVNLVLFSMCVMSQL